MAPGQGPQLLLPWAGCLQPLLVSHMKYSTEGPSAYKLINKLHPFPCKLKMFDHIKATLSIKKKKSNAGALVHQLGDKWQQFQVQETH